MDMGTAPSLSEDPEILWPSRDSTWIGISTLHPPVSQDTLIIFGQSNDDHEYSPHSHHAGIILKSLMHLHIKWLCMSKLNLTTEENQSLLQNSDSQARTCGTISLLTPRHASHAPPLSVLLILKGYRNKGNETGAVKGYILHLKGLEERIEIKPQPGASTVCTTVNSSFLTIHPVCTMYKMLQVPIIQLANEQSNHTSRCL